ncbi:hypothetical protein [Endozoicomonas sp. ALB115]|uniref:hypothetical protein n=1 Tax=Endozoicomonas sp. ALB115 TaxID=3403074 RepID=UPI003BB76B2E
MRINYFGYFLKHRNRDERVLFDLRDILKSFCKLNNNQYKSNFKYSDEHIFISHQVGDVYLFLMTRSHEIIKKINTNDLSVDDIQDLLNQNEKLGFASYILLKENYFSFGSTLLAPKFQVFADYINKILHSLNISDYEFAVEPLLHQATRSEIVKMPFLGRATIEIDKENSLTRDIINVVRCKSEDVEDIESIEIIIKPKRSKSIKPAVEKFIDSIEDKGLQKMIIKAKNETHSQLTELYLIGQGAISDIIGSVKEESISGVLETKADENQYLINKLSEFRKNERFEEADISHIVRFANLDSWTDLVPELRQDREELCVS